MDSNVISSLLTLCVEIVHGIILNWLKNIVLRIIKCFVWLDSDNIQYTANQVADLNLFQTSKHAHLTRWDQRQLFLENLRVAALKNSDRVGLRLVAFQRGEGIRIKRKSELTGFSSI